MGDAVFKLEIITPEETFFSGVCQAITVHLSDGSATFLAGHLPTLAVLPEGEIRIKSGDRWRSLNSRTALLKVTQSGAEIYSQGCMWPSSDD